MSRRNLSPQQMFEQMAINYGFPHMPDFLRMEDLATTYERLTDRTPRDLDWYFVYSALQLGIVYLRTGIRSVHFGEREAPSDPDELIMNAVYDAASEQSTDPEIRRMPRNTPT